MTRVFISHSALDRELVDSEIVPTLRGAGIDSWYSKDDIQVAEQWERSIQKGLAACDWFLLVMTPNSAESRWVRSELSWAMQYRWERIVPVLAADCKPDLFHLHLRQIQHVDFRKVDDEARGRLIGGFGATGNRSATLLQASAASVKSHSLSPPRTRFHCGPPVRSKFFIGRETEVADAKELIESQQSFLIIGHPRAGKTSLCHKLQDEYENDPNGSVLSSYVNLQGFSSLTLESFLERTVLNLAGEIARKIFGCRYTDLTSSEPMIGRSELARDDLFHSFTRVFRHIDLRTRTRGNRESEPLSPREFVDLTIDLLQIAAGRGRSRVIIFYDEANRLPVDVSENLLISIGEALHDTGVIGAYVASPEMAERFGRMDQLFGGRLIVGPFRSHDEMKQLLARFYFDDVGRVRELPTTGESLDMLWQLSGGVPFLIQLLAEAGFREARREGSPTVEPRHIQVAADVVRKERPSAFP